MENFEEIIISPPNNVRRNINSNGKNISKLNIEIHKKNLEDIFEKELKKDIEYRLKGYLDKQEQKLDPENFKKLISSIQIDLKRQLEITNKQIPEVKRYLDIKGSKNNGNNNIFLPGVTELTRISSFDLPNVLGFTKNEAKREKYSKFIIDMAKNILELEDVDLKKSISNYHPINIKKEIHSPLYNLLYFSLFASFLVNPNTFGKSKLDILVNSVTPGKKILLLPLFLLPFISKYLFTSGICLFVISNCLFKSICILLINFLKFSGSNFCSCLSKYPFNLYSISFFNSFSKISSKFFLCISIFNLLIFFPFEFIFLRTLLGGDIIISSKFSIYIIIK